MYNPKIWDAGSRSVKFFMNGVEVAYSVSIEDVIIIEPGVSYSTDFVYYEDIEYHDPYPEVGE